MPHRPEGPPDPRFRGERVHGMPIAPVAGMYALLTALVLAVSPEAPSPTESVPAKTAPRRAFWVEPVGAAILGLGPLDLSAFYLPIGVNLPLSETTSTSLGVELTLTTGPMRDANHRNWDGPRYWRVLAAAGPVFSLSGRPLSGLFVQPKFITHYSHEAGYGFGDSEHTAGSSLELRLGLDVGWQFTLGDLYLAPMLGLSAGYGFNMPLVGGATELSRVLPPYFMGYSPRRGNAPVLGLNLNLLRVGAVF